MEFYSPDMRLVFLLDAFKDAWKLKKTTTYFSVSDCSEAAQPLEGRVPLKTGTDSCLGGWKKRTKDAKQPQVQRSLKRPETGPE